MKGSREEPEMSRFSHGTYHGWKLWDVSKRLMRLTLELKFCDISGSSLGPFKCELKSGVMIIYNFHLQVSTLWRAVLWFPWQPVWVCFCACWHWNRSAPKRSTSSGRGSTRNRASSRSSLQVGGWLVVFCGASHLSVFKLMTTWR